MGIDLGSYSPAVLERVVCAGTAGPSFEQGRQALLHLAGLDVPTKQVERLTQAVGAERCAERDGRVAEHLGLPLPRRKEAPAGVVAPEWAAAQMGGGRLQILDRAKAVAEAPATDEASGRPTLQPRADTLSESGPLVAYWQRRQATATGQRRYRRSA